MAANSKRKSAKTLYSVWTDVNLHSEFYSSKNITSTTTHTLSDMITFFRTLVTKY